MLHAPLALPLAAPPVPNAVGCVLSASSLALAPGARDLALMQHDLTARFPSGRTERHTATLAEFGRGGEGGATAMAESLANLAALRELYLK